jgi:ATP-binding cassette subfamily B protein
MIRRLLATAGAGHTAALRGYLALLVLYSLLLGASFGLVVPVLRAVLAGDAAGAGRWLLALAVTVALAWTTYLNQAMRQLKLSGALLRSLYGRVAEHVVELPMGWFTPGRIGEFTRLVGPGVISVATVLDLLRPLVCAFGTSLVVLVVLAVVDWPVALAALVTVPLVVLAYRAATVLGERADREVETAAAEAGGRIVEFAQSQPLLRAFGRHEAGFAQLDEALLGQYRAGRSQVASGVAGVNLGALAAQLALTAVLVVGVTRVLGAGVGAPELLAAVVAVTRLTEMVSGVSASGMWGRAARANIDRIDELLATPTLPRPEHPRTPSGSGVELAGVRFAYSDHPDERPVLDGVDLTVPPGSTTAMVGASGAGKTTLIRLIARFWDVTEGAVRIGGVDVREMTVEDLMSRVSLVFQDVHLFDTTIEDNVRVGRPGATDEQVRDAARAARVDEIVERLPAGWATRVGEGGTALSGGERQRVSIARAILKDAPIVLLDEPTAALDAENEAAVGEAVRVLAADRTVLVIAHRLATVLEADQIVVLDGGRIVERGTRDELLAAEGRFAEFLAAQRGAAGWRLGR